MFQCPTLKVHAAELGGLRRPFLGGAPPPPTAGVPRAWLPGPGLWGWGAPEDVVEDRSPRPQSRPARGDPCAPKAILACFPRGAGAGGWGRGSRGSTRGSGACRAPARPTWATPPLRPCSGRAPPPARAPTHPGSAAADPRWPSRDRGGRRERHRVPTGRRAGAADTGARNPERDHGEHYDGPRRWWRSFGSPRE